MRRRRGHRLNLYGPRLSRGDDLGIHNRFVHAAKLMAPNRNYIELACIRDLLAHPVICG
ncbi:MAG TPA: hypothetical protein VGC82_15925 [Rhodopila sp.]